MSLHRFFWLDVFASAPLQGNPLAVVLEADDLSDDLMRAFARETNLSETTFVERAGAEGASYRNRIWTPSGEIPFAGHPSLGTAVAVAVSEDETEGSYVQETLAGLQRVGFSVDGRRAVAWVVQEEPRFGEFVPTMRAMDGLGLGPEDAASSPCQVVSTGLPTLIVPARTPEAVERARRDPVALGALLGGLSDEGRHNVYLVSIDGGGDVVARCLFPDGGEDPATGSAAGALCAYADRHLGLRQLRIRQGDAIGRPSTLRAEMTSSAPTVSGEVHLVASGTVELA